MHHQVRWCILPVMLSGFKRSGEQLSPLGFAI
jgi:hypothetical protein